jgi:hypothetical protein
VKLSALIKILDTAYTTHGDLQVMTQDGLDPSDFWPVESVAVEKDETWLDLGKVVNIRS